MQQPSAPSHTKFSDDGFWWWDGASWKPAVSPDRLWRWNGQAWAPATHTGGPAAPSGGSVGMAGGGPPGGVRRGFVPPPVPGAGVLRSTGDHIRDRIL